MSEPFTTPNAEAERKLLNQYQRLKDCGLIIEGKDRRSLLRGELRRLLCGILSRSDTDEWSKHAAAKALNIIVELDQG